MSTSVKNRRVFARDRGRRAAGLAWRAAPGCPFCIKAYRVHFIDARERGTSLHAASDSQGELVRASVRASSIGLERSSPVPAARVSLAPVSSTLPVQLHTAGARQYLSTNGHDARRSTRQVVGRRKRGWCPPLSAGHRTRRANRRSLTDSPQVLLGARKVLSRISLGGVGDRRLFLFGRRSGSCLPIRKSRGRRGGQRRRHRLSCNRGVWDRRLRCGGGRCPLG